MNAFLQLSPKARLYWLMIVLAGSLCVLTSTPWWSGISQHFGWRCTVYVVAAVLASTLKIQLPGVFGTLSMNYVVIIAALLNQGRGAGMIVAIASALGQCFIFASTTPTWFQIVFNTAGMALP